jgi:hypothetical protein
MPGKTVPFFLAKASLVREGIIDRSISAESDKANA